MTLPFMNTFLRGFPDQTVSRCVNKPTCSKPSLHAITIMNPLHLGRYLHCVMGDFNINSESSNKTAYPYPSLMTNMDAPRSRRSVSFQTLSQLCLYEAPQPEDNFTLWYTEEDKEVSKANTRLEASALQQMQRGETLALELEGISLHPDNLSIVGLEKYLLSSESKLTRLRLRRLVKLTVLMEQAHGSGSGDNKAERIACLAMRLSKWSVEQAKAIGKLQQKESRAKM